MIIEISVGVIAFAFVILVIYLVAMIQTMRGVLTQLSQTIIHLRPNLDEMNTELNKVIKHGNAISVDLQKKMEALNGIFESIECLGNLFKHKTESLTEGYLHSHKIEPLHASSIDPLSRIKIEKPHENEIHQVADFLELVGLSIRLWQKLKKRR
jgi:hypothetical protein